MTNDQTPDNEGLPTIEEISGFIHDWNQSKPDPIQQVAEMPCPCCAIENRIDQSGECSPCDTLPKGECAANCPNGCQGTGLRWPTLSRVCPRIYCIEKTATCDVCGGSGRIPDVTLDKVLTILADINEVVVLHHSKEGWGMAIDLTDRIARWATPVESTCIALIASVED